MSHVFKISDAATLALHTMVYLAGRRDSLVSTHEIASLFQVSEAHLSKVLQRLTKSGLVRPLRGPKGGFKLAKSPEQVSLLEVYENFDGKLEVSQCLLGSQVCGGGHCFLGHLLDNVNLQVKKYLEETTLSKVSSLGKLVEDLRNNKTLNNQG